MSADDRTTGEPFNAACAAGFRLRKAEIGAAMTYQALASATGMQPRQLKYLLSDHRQMHVGEFRAIARALGLDPAVAMANAQARVAEGAATPRMGD